VPLTHRLRPWLVLAAVALIAVVGLGLLLRRKPAPPAAEPEVEVEEPAAPTRKPPRFDDSKALRQQVAELSAKLDQVNADKARAAKEKERACLTSVTADCPFLDPTPEALAEMARCGIVRMDMPDLEFAELPSEEEARTDPEALAVAQARRELSGRVRDELRTLHADLGLAGDPPMKVRDFMEAIENGLARADAPAIRRQIARERAGLAAPPPADSQGPADRFWRLKAGLGDEYESLLAGKLSPARARAMRKAGNGWPFRGVYTGSCEGDGGR
jgi:hypothetical protein